MSQHIEPYGRNDRAEKKFNLEGSYSSEKSGSGMRSTLGSRPLSPDYETKEIKNIYVDSKFSSQSFLFSELVGLPIVTLLAWLISMSVEFDCSTNDTNKCEGNSMSKCNFFPF